MPAILIRRARRTAAAGGVAAAVLVLGLQAIAAPRSSEQEAVPRDALTLVRQALAALEVSPPDVDVATERVIKALFAPDTRGVDMPRVRDAAQALGSEDATAGAAYLMQALRPAEAGPTRLDPSLFTPLPPRATSGSEAYGLLGLAALLVAAGSLIVRR